MSNHLWVLFDPAPESGTLHRKDLRLMYESGTRLESERGRPSLRPHRSAGLQILLIGYSSRDRKIQKIVLSYRDKQNCV